MDRSRAFTEDDAGDDPVRLFRRWLAEARRHVELPDAVALATATADGRPSARMVLLKSADERGFTFFTNYESRKGRELAANPRAALLFHWYELGWQVRIEGRVERVPAAESEAYWLQRPVASRRSNASSRQSEVIDGREELERAAAALGDDVARPERWGGYLLVPEEFEFWQHRDDRLHDRIRFRLDAGTWVRERLAP